MTPRQIKNLNRINAKHAGQPEWQVTVTAEGNRPETYALRAPHKESAKTCVMFLYGQPLQGEMVTYEVRQLESRQ
jgi:hypothetical protein